MQPMVLCRGGEYHRLHVQFRPPDDGPVRPETCRGRGIADTVCRRKRIVYRVGNKEKQTILVEFAPTAFYCVSLPLPNLSCDRSIASSKVSSKECSLASYKVSSSDCHLVSFP